MPAITRAAGSTLTENDAFYMASSLFDEAEKLTATPSDGVYADHLISLAFNHLVAGIQAAKLSDKDGVRDCADAIECCTWLSGAMRTHVGNVLRAVADGQVSQELAIQIVLGASNRTAQHMLVDGIRAIGSDGFGALADAIDGLSAAIMDARH
jgi:hypothetical protein